MQNTLTFLLARLKSRFGQAVLTVIIATIILSYPSLTAWMDETMRKWIMDTAYAIRNLALPILIMFAKAFNETGGTKPMTNEAVRRTPDDAPEPPNQ